jgi:hypothetical protein
MSPQSNGLSRMQFPVNFLRVKHFQMTARANKVRLIESV